MFWQNAIGDIIPISTVSKSVRFTRASGSKSYPGLRGIPTAPGGDGQPARARAAALALDFPHQSTVLDLSVVVIGTFRAISRSSGAVRCLACRGAYSRNTPSKGRFRLRTLFRSKVNSARPESFVVMAWARIKATVLFPR